MPQYAWGSTSLRRLEGVRAELVETATKALEFMDLTVQQHGGHRSAETQHVLFERQVSHKDGYVLLSRHQSFPSEALDLAPYPIDWQDSRRWYYMGGLLRSIGESLGSPVRWLGDQDSDGEVADQSFDDLGHIELLS